MVCAMLPFKKGAGHEIIDYRWLGASSFPNFSLFSHPKKAAGVLLSKITYIIGCSVNFTCGVISCIHTLEIFECNIVLNATLF